MANPARMRKADLVTAFHMLEAQLEAERARCQGLQSDFNDAQSCIADLHDQLSGLQTNYRDTVHNMVLVNNRGELLRRLAKLAAQGMPCHMQGDVIKHRQTGTVLVQVRPAG